MRYPSGANRTPPAPTTGSQKNAAILSAPIRSIVSASASTRVPLHDLDIRDELPDRVAVRADPGQRGAVGVHPVVGPGARQDRPCARAGRSRGSTGARAWQRCRPSRSRRSSGRPCCPDRRQRREPCRRDRAPGASRSRQRCGRRAASRVARRPRARSRRGRTRRLRTRGSLCRRGSACPTRPRRSSLRRSRRRIRGRRRRPCRRTRARGWSPGAGYLVGSGRPVGSS